MGKKLLWLLVAGLVLLCALTWGSVGSGMILVGLLVGFGFTGYRRYMENRDEDWYVE